MERVWANREKFLLLHSRYDPLAWLRMIWKVNGQVVDLSCRAQVMGILNVTPDSFSDGGCFDQVEKAMVHAREMIGQGALIIDIGGESTRPGAAEVLEAEEMQRTIPVIERLRREWDGLISIDTKKAGVAAAAIQAGANIVNDVSGLTADPEMISVCVKSDCGLVVMHMQGNPETMQTNPSYHEVVSEIRAFFEERLATLIAAGIERERICFDPGIGFGKTLEHNLTLLKHLDQLAPDGQPLLLGVSRKSFFAKLFDAELPSQRDAATAAATALARQQGVMLHRVHDVKGNLAALRVCEGVLIHQSSSRFKVSGSSDC
jgi:dihydropteroate synthase